MSLFNLIDSESISAASTKRYGETGSPCLHPLPKFIESEKLPFCRIFDEEPFCNDCTQFIVSVQKLNRFKVFVMNSHDIESKAFSKSINKISPFCFRLLHSLMISYVSCVFSPINLLIMNPFWSGWISFGKIFLILFAIRLEKNL